MNDEQVLLAAVHDAAARGKALSIQGGGSKSFYGRTTSGETLSLGNHRGIVDYTPTELVISARAGTPLAELEATLAQENQMLAFEPPRFGTSATLGGTIACGLSGPRRPYAGSARDHVLGMKCINGKGEILRLGGQVMKNVAGYDLARTLTGSLGTLAVMLEISLKVVPRPETELTLWRECDPQEALRLFNQWAGKPLPLSGGCHIDGKLHVRLSGNRQGVESAVAAIGGEPLAAADSFWNALREHTLPLFTDETPLWRLSVAPATAPLDLAGNCLLDWGGAQRWLKSTLPASDIQATARQTGGHATLFRGGDHGGQVFQPLDPGLLALHRRIKKTFDPAGILNPGRMYAGI